MKTSISLSLCHALVCNPTKPNTKKGVEAFKELEKMKPEIGCLDE